MFQLDVDIVMELQNLLPSYYDLIVPSVVIDELTTLKKKSKGKNKLAASIAYTIANKEPFNIVNIKKTDHVDNLLLKLLYLASLYTLTKANIYIKELIGGINTTFSNSLTTLKSFLK